MTDRFTDFLKSLEADTYPELPSDGHTAITAAALPPIVAMCPPGARVLDVGCGQGVALKLFGELGCKAYGITTNHIDFGACALSYSVSMLDMHDVASDYGWPPDLCEPFDLIWARHVLEHSPAPLFALREFWRVLKPGGWLYIEVPMPGTSCRHETNQNHYSVLTCGMWQALIAKAKFQLIEGQIIPLNTQAGPDEYRSYLCRK